MLLPGTLFLIALAFTFYVDCTSNVSVQKSRIWGPGLHADFLVPVRYFYVQLVNKDGSNVTESVGEDAITVSVVSGDGSPSRIWSQVLDRHDGSYIVRYRLYSTTSGLQISVHFKGRHIAGSPYRIAGNIYHDTCDCPHQTVEQWAQFVGCPATYSQIREDLEIFKDLDMTKVAKEAVERYNRDGQHSLCHYKIVENKVYRKCYGQHVGFNMFGDAILLSLTRKMLFPNFEFFLNLGDWPLVTRKQNPLPVFSWCGSKQTFDIVLPTYDITEATLEMMGRVSLDLFSTQANTGPNWANKSNTAFWRGRDSRRERLDLVEMSLKNPDLIDARLTNMFFFPKNPEKFGELVKQVSFFDFFKHKYQLNIDGTVAAYRFPYLLAGDSVVFKQDSDYYEHFYRELTPYVHYIPIKHDLSDVIEKIKWARENDEEVHQIAKNGQHYARAHLTPADILCYHVRVFQHYASLIKKGTKGIKEFDLVNNPDDRDKCNCPKKKVTKHTEL
ncbi:protein O-glucosyltransferase 2-like [Biomphalaria glabrata]|uniref:Protein O-glucosyltransferase 2-like n=1 Tax=Biomphalaria glabrata TaxID=6526 RepID=A0A9W3AZC0_BIOGL|nr:protein O-glucosyltransferase 2-like [Biomphalaria glabrata]